VGSIFPALPHMHVRGAALDVGRATATIPVPFAVPAADAAATAVKTGSRF